MIALKLEEISYHFNERKIFSNITFELLRGQWMLVTGPNGVGKTTLLKLIVGLLSPTTGKIIQRLPFAYLGHKWGIRLALSPYENLLGLAPRKILLSTLEAFGLLADIHRPAAYLSAGQKKRLALAQVCLQPAALWVLDEPLNDLDLSAQTFLQTLLQEQLNAGTALIVVSHFAMLHMSAAHQCLCL